jgi:polar amino acid transport system substrate-binding protein
MTIAPSIISTFTPAGHLRASINLGNPILANRDPATNEPFGVSVDLAHEFARRLGVEIELVVLETAGKSVETVKNEQADIGFFAIDPLRGEGILFTKPYVLIEGSYLVKNESPLQSNEDVDRAEHQITVGKGSAYDLFLTRELKNAQILRAPSSPAVVDTFLSENADVAAGVKQQLESDARRLPGMRLLPGRFMVIEQAMGTPKSRGQQALEVLADFVEEMKQSGFVAEALRRHGIEGAAVAPMCK